MNVLMTSLYFRFAALLVAMSLSSIGGTDAYFTSAALSNSLSFFSGDDWEVSGDVVINEIMWMGSVGDSDDEWIELRNTTGSSVDLTGWSLDGAKSGLPGTLSLSGTIDAGGYFLISRKATSDSFISDAITADMVVSGLSLVNGGEVLALKNQYDQTIDETGAGSWAAGSDGVTRHSMERNNITVPGDGVLGGSWHDCIDLVCNDTDYWDVEGDDYGTPRALNHSDNDLSLLILAEEIEEENEEEEILEEDGVEEDSSTTPEATPSSSPTPTTEPEEISTNTDGQGGGGGDGDDGGDSGGDDGKEEEDDGSGGPEDGSGDEESENENDDEEGEGDDSSEEDGEGGGDTEDGSEGDDGSAEGDDGSNEEEEGDGDGNDEEEGEGDDSSEEAEESDSGEEV